MVPDRPPQEAKLAPGAPGEPAPFGSYYLLGMIARGGMAEVYRARPKDCPKDGPRRLLAIKVMRPQLAREARFVDMFHREGKLAMMLQNRCIVETLELGQAEGRHYITMEYIGGRDLTQVLRRCQETQQRIPVPHAVYIAARIAEGLHFAHTLGHRDGRPLNIVNRDVSPSNVRLSYDGDVKLLDFGIAQALVKFTSEIGILKGKFSYMSPEQIRGMPLDARTDVFSAGIILHEMLTTEKLFRGDTEFALMEKVRKAEVPAPSEFNRRVTAELDAICLKALSRDLADRYQTAAQLAAALDALISGYRFDPKELRQFVRQLFRKEYAKEVEDTQLSLDASIAPAPPPRAAPTAPMWAVSPPDSAASPMGPGARNGDAASSQTQMPRTGTPSTSAPVPGAPASAAKPEGSGAPEGPGSDKPRGFLGSLFRKRK